ncbi:hypothetical protein CEUSTIGMA_g4918.t1 [Chlamydomonas eustigma]|uniref:Uncharacterized protein n=1 Tax=Chlamydomonas eustigma TaxID=1157962 RepID=A0A250X313_9CHLO|nr:hypothetical protein CEUSTIGMA_g4918.t1 [Chlamydomonas eustigma]|eukprot:GAX77474.1 hypothetical protein CEUSTIGMA_g4918.t1 [Chlamydomonas eustigma]
MSVSLDKKGGSLRPGRGVLIQVIDENMVDEEDVPPAELKGEDKEFVGRFVQSLHGGSAFIRQPWLADWVDGIQMRLPSLKLEDINPPPKQLSPDPPSPTEGKPLAQYKLPTDVHPLNCLAETTALVEAIDSSFVQNHVQNILQRREQVHEDKWLEAEAMRRARNDSKPWQWSVDNFEFHSNAATVIQRCFRAWRGKCKAEDRWPSDDNPAHHKHLRKLPSRPARRLSTRLRASVQESKANISDLKKYSDVKPRYMDGIRHVKALDSDNAVDKKSKDGRSKQQILESSSPDFPQPQPPQSSPWRMLESYLSVRLRQCRPLGRSETQHYHTGHRQISRRSFSAASRVSLSQRGTSGFSASLRERGSLVGGDASSIAESGAGLGLGDTAISPTVWTAESLADEEYVKVLMGAVTSCNMPPEPHPGVSSDLSALYRQILVGLEAAQERSEAATVSTSRPHTESPDSSLSSADERDAELLVLQQYQGKLAAAVHCGLSLPPVPVDCDLMEGLALFQQACQDMEQMCNVRLQAAMSCHDKTVSLPVPPEEVSQELKQQYEQARREQQMQHKQLKKSPSLRPRRLSDGGVIQQNPVDLTASMQQEKEEIEMILGVSSMPPAEVVDQVMDLVRQLRILVISDKNMGVSKTRDPEVRRAQWKQQVVRRCNSAVSLVGLGEALAAGSVDGCQNSKNHASSCTRRSCWSKHAGRVLSHALVRALASDRSLLKSRSVILPTERHRNHVARLKDSLPPSRCSSSAWSRGTMGSRSQEEECGSVRSASSLALRSSVEGDPGMRITSMKLRASTAAERVKEHHLWLRDKASHRHSYSLSPSSSGDSVHNCEGSRVSFEMCSRPQTPDSSQSSEQWMSATERKLVPSSQKSTKSKPVVLEQPPDNGEPGVKNGNTLLSAIMHQAKEPILQDAGPACYKRETEVENTDQGLLRTKGSTHNSELSENRALVRESVEEVNEDKSAHTLPREISNDAAAEDDTTTVAKRELNHVGTLFLSSRIPTGAAVAAIAAAPPPLSSLLTPTEVFAARKSTSARAMSNANIRSLYAPRHDNLHLSSGRSVPQHSKYVPNIEWRSQSGTAPHDGQSRLLEEPSEVSVSSLRSSRSSCPGSRLSASGMQSFSSAFPLPSMQNSQTHPNLRHSSCGLPLVSSRSSTSGTSSNECIMMPATWRGGGGGPAAASQRSSGVPDLAGLATMAKDSLSGIQRMSPRPPTQDAPRYCRLTLDTAVGAAADGQAIQRHAGDYLGAASKRLSPSPPPSTLGAHSAARPLTPRSTRMSLSGTSPYYLAMPPRLTRASFSGTSATSAVLMAQLANRSQKRREDRHRQLSGRQAWGLAAAAAYSAAEKAERKQQT